MFQAVQSGIVSKRDSHLVTNVKPTKTQVVSRPICNGPLCCYTTKLCFTHRKFPTQGVIHLHMHIL